MGTPSTPGCFLWAPITSLTGVQIRSWRNIDEAFALSLRLLGTANAERSAAVSPTCLASLKQIRVSGHLLRAAQLAGIALILMIGSWLRVLPFYSYSQNKTSLVSDKKTRSAVARANRLSTPVNQLISAQNLVSYTQPDLSILQLARRFMSQVVDRRNRSDAVWCHTSRHPPAEVLAIDIAKISHPHSAAPHYKERPRRFAGASRILDLGR
jgi:hypothetical protein